MKKSPIIWLLIALVGIMIIGLGSQIASANNNTQSIGNNTFREQVAAGTDLPTPLPVSEEAQTPEARVLPPVWSNAGLVLGASVLVLIIVGGVLGARLRRKH